MSLEQHHKNAVQALKVAIITVSDTRDLDSDKSGQLIATGLEGVSHGVVDRTVVRDEATLIAADLRRGGRDHSQRWYRNRFA